MNDWWEALSQAQKFFYLIAIPSTVILVIQFILSFVGFDSDSDVEVDFDGDGLDPDTGSMDHSLADATDFRFVTFRGIIAFLTIFGWVGAVLTKGHLNILMTIFISTSSGLIAMVLVALMFYSISLLQTNGNIDYKNALGAFAEVYIPIPPSNTGMGKVQVMIQNRLVEADAMTFLDDAINTGEMVRVVDLFNQTTLVVEKEK